MSENTYYQAGANESATQEASATPVSESQDVANVGGQEQPGNEPVTQAQLKAAIEDAVRKAQSMTDKMGASVDKRIKEAKERAELAIKIVEEGGIKLTEEQKRAILHGETDKAIVPPDAAQSSLQEGRGQQQPDPTEQMVNAEVQKIMERTHTYISPQEARVLIGDVDSPYEYLKRFEEIAHDRATQAPSESRVPSMAPVSGKAPSLQAQYDAEMKQIMEQRHPTIRRGEAEKILKMKAEYRKKGLDI
jgi:DNA-directed RNA polymerase subunit F